MTMKRLSEYLAGALFCLLLLGTGFIFGYEGKLINHQSHLIAQLNTRSDVAQNIGTEDEEFMRRFFSFYDAIRSNWVGEISDEELIDAAIKGMIDQLDEFSSYMKQEEYNDLKESTHGKFLGIGIQISQQKETKYIEIVSPFDDSPADRAGLKPGDLITHVDGEDVTLMTLEDASKKIRGARFSKVVLTIKRGENNIQDVEIVRDIVNVADTKFMLLNNNIGYIKLSGFNDNAADDMIKSVVQINRSLPQNSALNGLILDLRNNPGGLLDQAVEISDLFLDRGNIVHTKGRYGEIQQSWDAYNGQIVSSSLPIVVLINSGSASASEIVTGALKDLNRATIVGVKSYGKGSVQTIMNMPYGTGLRLTTQYYYTASNAKIHGIGITPDIVVQLPEEYTKKNWQVVDPQILVAVKVLLEGYTGQGPCKWTVVQDNSEDDGYGIDKVCDVVN